MPRVRKKLERLLCDSSEDVVETARISLERYDHAEAKNEVVMWGCWTARWETKKPVH